MKRCIFCGDDHEGSTYKGGFVCENCLDYIKNLNEEAEVTTKEPVVSLKKSLFVSTNSKCK